MFAPPVTQAASRAAAPKAAPGRAPNTAVGNQARLRGLPAAPIVRQAEAPNVVRRDIAEADIATTPVSQIMADPNYFENGMAHIRNPAQTSPWPGVSRPPTRRRITGRTC
jgi:hypothetical protein